MIGGALTIVFSHHGVPEENQTESKRWFNSFPDFVWLLCLRASVVNSLSKLFYLIRSVVHELHVDAEILLPQHGDHFLKRVAVFAADADEIALDRCLGFLFRILD